MSYRKPWEEYFTSYPQNEGEEKTDWFRRIASETGEAFRAVKDGYYTHIFKNVPENILKIKKQESEKNIKPDLKPFQHFSSPEWELPEGIEEVKPQYIIEGERLLSLKDIHLPFHEKKSLIAAINEGKRRNVDVVLLDGDTADCTSLSKFNKSVFDRSFKDELDLERGFLKWLREQFPKAQIIFKEGNHEKRFQDYIRSKADALDGIEEIELKSLLRLDNFGIKHIEHTQILKFGKLNIIHGHEYFGGGTINIARSYLLKSFDNIMFGHRHQIQKYIKKKINGELVGAWAIGCLCKLAPAYMSLNEWGNGFALVEKTTDGNFRVHNKEIQDGEIL